MLEKTIMEGLEIHTRIYTPPNVISQIPARKFWHATLTNPPLKIIGKVEVKKCPFCHKKHGGFFVNFTTGAFICESCHAKGNNIIDFVMLRQRSNCVDAMRWVVKHWKIKEDNFAEAYKYDHLDENEY